MQSQPVVRVCFRGADLRPRRTLAGSRGYYRCALSPDEALVAFAVRPLRYDDVGNAGPGYNLLPTGAPRSVAHAELWVVPLAAASPDGVSATAAGTPEAAAKADTGTNGAHALTAGWGTSWGPCWSPDGRWLAFYSDRNGRPQVWLWERESGATRLACDESAIIRFGFEGMRWLPDSRRLVAKLRVPGWQPPAQVPGAMVKGRRDVWTSPLDEHALDRRDEGLRYLALHRGDLAVIDTETGEARRVGTKIVPLGLAVSPDGRYVAAMCARDEEPGEQNLNVLPFDLHLFAVDGSLHHVVAARIAQSYGCDFSWSPRGDALAYIAQAWMPGGASRLGIVGLDGHEAAVWNGAEGMSFGRHEKMTPPLWSPDGQRLYASGERGGHGTTYAADLASGEVCDLGLRLPDKEVTGIVFQPGTGTVPEFGLPGTLVVVTRDQYTSRAGLFRLNGVGNGEAVSVVPERGGGLRDILLKGDAGRRWIVSQSGDELCAIDTQNGSERWLTRLNPHIEQLPRMTSFLIPMQGLQGEQREAAVWLPLAYEAGRRYPLVVNLYLGRQAGPSGNDPQKLPLTARGYVVVDPDMPHVHGVEPAEAVTRYALAALDATVDYGVADPDRAAVMGHSAGGYDVCCVVTRTDRFRAAIAAAPFADLASFALQVTGGRLSGAGQVEGGHARLGGTLWEQRERYVENSPVFHLDQVTSPLLLLCGIVDSLMAQAEEMYAGLLRLGKMATLVRYHGEGHVPYGSWTDENFDDYWARTLVWLDRYLAEPAAAP